MRRRPPGGCQITLAHQPASQPARAAESPGRSPYSGKARGNIQTTPLRGLLGRPPPPGSNLHKNRKRSLNSCRATERTFWTVFATWRLGGFALLTQRRWRLGPVDKLASGILKTMNKNQSRTRRHHLTATRAFRSPPPLGLFTLSALHLPPRRR